MPVSRSSRSHPRKRRAYLLKHGNHKLGRIYTFSIPARATCPYRTPTCERYCYALRHFYATPDARTGLERSLQATHEPDFVERILEELQRRSVDVVRVHAAGDLYSVGYAHHWLSIFTQAPRVRFFLYTRSWRGEEFQEVLTQMARRRNVRLWFSLDQDTGPVLWDRIPPRVRLAYLSTSPTDVLGDPVDLIFRTRRKQKVLKMEEALVCPKENGNPAGEALSCQSCRLCLGPLQEDLLPENQAELPEGPQAAPTLSVKDPRRYTLPMVLWPMFNL